MEKYIKFTLIALLLISSFKYSNTAECNTATTKDDCSKNTACEWEAATPSCKGGEACTASTITDKDGCEAEDTGCAYEAGSPATCTKSNAACNNGFTDKTTCEKCQWDTTSGTCKDKSTGTDPEEDFGSCLKFSGLIALLLLLF